MFVCLLLIYGAWCFSRTLFTPALSESPKHLLIERQSIADYSQLEFNAARKEIDAVWERLEAQLRVLAPASYRALAPPSSEKEILDVEAELGFRLPKYLRASLMRHNGTKDYLGVFRLWSAETILSQHKNEAMKLLDEHDLHFFDLNYRLGTWDPGTLAIGTNYMDLIVVLDDSRMLIRKENSYSGPHTKNFLETLAYMADAMENENFEIQGTGDQRSLRLLGWGCPHY